MTVNDAFKGRREIELMDSRSQLGAVRAIKKKQYFDEDDYEPMTRRRYQSETEAIMMICWTTITQTTT
jgi:hypothetical protein